MINGNYILVPIKIIKATKKHLIKLDHLDAARIKIATPKHYLMRAQLKSRQVDQDL